ncbi:DUF2155 domain-containing protein [Pelagerythrobacter sp.]|uniref:DUF2155 domain-containing protein n=1 Tax=Pelagerythrobacter sp. TaxID=2800702 RepID=UPI0035B25407
MRALAAALTLAIALAGCTEQAPTPQPEETEIPEALRQAAPPQVVGEGGAGTPMEDRVGTIGLLNKRNNLSQDFELSPGEAQRAGDVIVRMAACERTAPWEVPRETGAFVQVFIRSPGDEGEWSKIFSGWLFKNSPSLNVVEHPIYDVWVKDCAMSFPGEDEDDSASDSSEA